MMSASFITISLKPQKSNKLISDFEMRWAITTYYYTVKNSIFFNYKLQSSASALMSM